MTAFFTSRAQFRYNFLTILFSLIKFDFWERFPSMISLKPLAQLSKMYFTCTDKVWGKNGCPVRSVRAFS